MSTATNCRATQLAVALSFVVVASLSAQATPPSGMPVMPSTNPARPSCDGDRLDAATFNAILDQRFSALVSPVTEGIPGSFLAVDIKDAQASAAQTFVSGSGLALTVSAHGGINDGAVAIFNDATLSPKFGGAIQLHFLAHMKRSLQFTTSSCEALELTVRKAEAAHALRIAEIESNASSVQRRLDSAALVAKAAKIDSTLEAFRKNPPQSAADTLRRDSVNVERARIASRREWLDSIPVPETLSEKLAANNDLGKAYRDAGKLLDVRGFAFGWWSLGFSLHNSSFDLFDPGATLAAQISKRTFVTRAATVTYSRIRQSTFQDDSWYFALAAKAGLENNVADLTKLDITDRQQYVAPPTERVAEKKTTVYQGNYRDDLETIALNADLYKFFVPQNRLAVHVFPAYSAKTSRIGEVALGAGLLLSARNATKKTSIANAELFYNVPDLGNVRHSKDGPWKRGALGLRLTFPINFAPGT